MSAVRLVSYRVFAINVTTQEWEPQGTVRYADTVSVKDVTKLQAAKLNRNADSVYVEQVYN